MANKGSYPGAPPKYMNDFTKALSVEVKLLLEEVGKLRDERRMLQYEIAELMALKSKHGAGGEYIPDWAPKVSLASSLPPTLQTIPIPLFIWKREPTPPPASPPPLAIEDVQPAKPAWRTVHKKPERKPKPKALPPPPADPVPGPPLEPPRNLPSWAQWRPNPVFSPQPKVGTSSAPLPAPAPVAPRGGLFGPPSPPPK
ncbi:hypothetical protein NLI96_g10734 [Meripilus lineatus]|uniref:Uncharacterized protein n=1 Tax=Meripilus lineatus TaxID=2056292 RepID=A0AAD5UTE0_9APHY|nr:hypothetical protein NLI96_g10734 [Physisporinus lineatus]